MAVAGRKTRTPSRHSVEAIRRLNHADPAERMALEAVLVKYLDAMERSKWVRALQIYENASFLCGNHDVRFGYQAGGAGLVTLEYGRDHVSPQDRFLPHTYDNRLVRPTEKMVALFCKGRPTPRVEPNSDQPDDRQAAEIGAIVTQLYMEEPLRLPELRRRAALTAAICGTSAIETEYGSTDIPVVRPKTELREVPKSRRKLFPVRPGTDPNQPVMEEVEVGEEVVYKADVQARVWSSLHLSPNPGATSEQDMIWLGRCTFEDIDNVYEAFADGKESDGVYVDKIDQASSTTGADCALYWYHRIQDLVDAPHSAWSSRAPSAWELDGQLAPNHALHYVVDVKPNRHFPRGRTMYMLGGKLIAVLEEARAWRPGYEERWHEYVFWRWFRLEGRFWGIAPLSLAVPMQKKINAIDAAIQANRHFMAFGQFFIPRHSNVKKGFFSGIPGEAYQYRDIPGHAKPERVRNDPLPPELIAERDWNIQSINDVFASTLSDPAVAASAARAESILEFLRNERLEGKEPAVQEFEAMIEGMGRNVLIDIQFALGGESDPALTRRILAAARDKSELAVSTFTGTMLRDNTHVRFDIASEIMRSPEAQAAKARELLQYGSDVLSPEQIQGVFDAMGMGDFMKTTEVAAVKRAKWIIAQVLEGNFGAATLYPKIDVPELMLPVVQRFILGERYVTIDPQRRKVIADFFYLLQAQVEAMMAQRLAAQAAAQGETAAA